MLLQQFWIETDWFPEEGRVDVVPLDRILCLLCHQRLMAPILPHWSNMPMEGPHDRAALFHTREEKLAQDSCTLAPSAVGGSVPCVAVCTTKRGLPPLSPLSPGNRMCPRTVFFGHRNYMPARQKYINFDQAVEDDHPLAHVAKFVPLQERT